MEPVRGDDLRVPGADAARSSCPSGWPRCAPSARAGACPCAVIGRVTADGDIAIVRAASPRRSAQPGAREIARIPAAPLTSDAIVHDAARRAADPPPRRARRRAARGVASDRLPERGMDPGAVLLALLGTPEPRLAAAAVFEQYDSTVQANTVGRAGPRRGRPAGQGHDQGARRLDRREPGGRRARPVARRGAERRRGDPQRRRSPARGRSASPTASTSATRPGPRRSGSSRRRCAGWATRAGRSACRSPAATCRSTTSRLRGAIAPTPQIGVVGLLDDVATARRSGLRRRGRRGRPGRRGGPGLAGSAYADLAGVAAGGRPAVARPGSRSGASRRSSARRSRAASSRRPRTSPAAGSRSPSPSAAIWGGVRRATLRLHVSTRRPSSCSARARRDCS